MRYVVMVKPFDDHPAEVAIFGPWRELEKAQRFRDSIRKAVDKYDAEDVGYAWIARLNRPLVRDGKRYAIEGVRP